MRTSLTSSPGRSATATPWTGCGTSCRVARCPQTADSPHHHAPADVDRLPGDVAAVLRGQEADQGGDVLRDLRAPEGGTGGHLLEQLARLLPHQLPPLAVDDLPHVRVHDPGAVA